MMLTPEEHGAKLAAALRDHDLTLATAADLIGVSPRTVRNWTTGRTMPSLPQYFRLRDLLGDYDGSLE